MEEVVWQIKESNNLFGEIEVLREFENLKMNFMNDKEKELYRILDIVVGCCAMQVSEDGTMSLTREDVLGKSRAENVVMTRCILVTMIISAGFSVTTASQLLGRTPHAIRHLLEIGQQYVLTSRAYRLANAEATLLCKDISI